MRKHFFLPLVAIAILSLLLWLFTKAYRELNNYAELKDRHDKVLNHFQQLSKQVNNAAVLNPALVNAFGDRLSSSPFFTDSNKVVQELELLKSTVKDSINVSITAKLDTLIRSEIDWLLKSNVPDSIIHNKAPLHIAAFEQIDSLFAAGIARTNSLVVYRRELVNKEIRSLRTVMIVFVLLSIFLLLYTFFKLLRQRRRTRQKELELEIVLNRISDGVVSVDNNWCYTFLNDAAMLTHPLGKKETQGKSIWEIHPEMKGTVFWDKYHEAMTTKKVVEIESFYAPMGVYFSVKVYPSADGLTIFYKDITQTKKLEEQQFLLASIVDSSSDAILSKNLSGIITSWNNGAEKIFGYAAEEVTGKHISVIIPAHLEHEESEIISRIYNERGFEHYKTQRIRKDGIIIYVSLTISLVKNAAGTIVGASSISRDITKEKETEEKLAASEMRFRSLIENSADGITLADEQSNSIYRSPAAQKIMGHLPKENAISRTHPDDLQLMRNIHVRVLENPGVPVSFAARFLHAAGIYIWLEGIFTNMLHLPEVKAIVTNFRDITDRKAAEEKLIRSEKIYKTIASSIPGSVICLFDENYRYILIEGDMLEKFGYSREILLGNKAGDVLSPEVYEPIRERLDRVFKGETVMWETNYNGYDVISRYIPLKDEHKNVYAIMTVSIDVTELKKAQHAILELNADLEKKIQLRTEELKKSNEDLEAFSYSVSHDLRAPLRSIIGFSAILEEEYGAKLDDEAKRLTGIIKDNTLKMARLIDDLLAFSKTGKLQLSKTSINTYELVREVQEQLLQQNTGYSDITWQIHTLPVVQADLNTIRQVWVNLLSNAAKYSSNKKQPVIEIGWAEEKEQVVFFVKDNGVGFDEEYKDKLFKVFQRLHDPHEFEGTGVGLALVDKIVARHGGKVWAEGKENEGAVFYFSLPL